jgi:hypothetical protein
MQKIEDILKTVVSEAFLSYIKTMSQLIRFKFRKPKRNLKVILHLVVFPLLRFSGKKPEETAAELGNLLSGIHLLSMNLM